MFKAHRLVYHSNLGSRVIKKTMTNRNTHQVEYAKWVQTYAGDYYTIHAVLTISVLIVYE